MPAPSPEKIETAGIVLAKISAYDPTFRHDDDAVILAWASALTIANVPRDVAIEAVDHMYANATGNFRPLPGILIQYCREIRARTAEHQEYIPPDKSADPPPPELHGARKISMAEWEQRHGEKFPKIALGLDPDEPTEFDGPNPLQVRCPHCKAGPGSPCVVAGEGTSQVLTKTRAHPCRFAVVEGRCASYVGYHVTPHSTDCELYQ